MKHDTIKQQAKQVNIVDYLAGLGIEPKRAKGTSYLYSAPYREDRNPSMLVDSTENVFTDLGGNNDKGDIITLVQLIHQADFMEALSILTSTSYPSFSFIQPKLSSSNGIELLKVKKLENRALIEYLGERKVSLDIARAYLDEAYFTLNGKSRVGNKAYFGLYFPNESGGAELRSRKFKGCLAPKSYSFIKGKQSTQVNIFEGFTDFLAALSMKGSSRPSYDTLVLNSIVLLPKVLPLLTNYPQINCFLDNDDGGNKATRAIREEVDAKVVDYRIRYKGCKDFAEWWEDIA